MENEPHYFTLRTSKSWFLGPNAFKGRKLWCERSRMSVIAPRCCRGAMNSLMAELLEGHIRSHVLDGRQSLLPSRSRTPMK